MTKGQKAMLVVGVGALSGVALVKFKASQAPARDFALGAAVGGSAVLLLDALMSEPDDAILALPNPFMSRRKKEGMGHTPKAAIELLSHVNPDLYDDFKSNGVKIAAVPANPSIVNQDAQ